MGNFLDRSRDDDELANETVDQSSNPHGQHSYLYPPRSGDYFAGHCIMGGRRFKTGQHEAYLFGDNMDLNFLGPKPIPFPYLAPLPNEPTRSLRALINIRKETLRLIKIPNTIDELINHHHPISSKSSSGNLTIIPPIVTPDNPITGNHLIPSSSASYPGLTDQLSNGSVKQINENSAERKKQQHSSSSSIAAPASSQPESSSLSTKPTTSLSSSSLNSTSSHPRHQTQTKDQLETDQLLDPSSSATSNPDTTNTGPLYTIEFTFDSDVKCSICIYFLALEEVTSTSVTYIPRYPTYRTETFHYPKGSSQVFSQSKFIFNPSAFNEDDLLYRAIDEFGNFDPSVPFPIVIQLNAEEGFEPRQSHSLIATVERNNEKQFNIKPFKQKIVIDGLAYLIQEVYGIENKNTVRPNYGKTPYYTTEEEIEDNGSECVICMSESRDTLILPCRHLCLCNECADNLRYKANNCPICRSPFRALLQFRAVRKISNNGATLHTSAAKDQSTDPLNISTSSEPKNHRRLSSESRNALNPVLAVDRSKTKTTHSNGANNSDDDDDDEKIEIPPPPGYEEISLIEALNGPVLIPSSSPRPGDYGGIHAFQGSFDDEDVAPLASIEATTRSISGSSQSMICIKDRDGFRKQMADSVGGNSETKKSPSSSRGIKPSSASLSEIRYPLPSSSSSPKMSYRSKSISKSKLLIINTSAAERATGGGDSIGLIGNRRKSEKERSSVSLGLWSSGHGSTESGLEDHERVKLLDQENYSHHHNRPHHQHHPHSPLSYRQSTPMETVIPMESTKNRRTQRREKGSLANDSELRALNQCSNPPQGASHQHSDSALTSQLDLNSINLSPTSHPNLFLTEGADEQRFVDETDLILDSPANDSSSSPPMPPSK